MPRLTHTPRQQPRPPESSSPAWATRGDCLRRNRCLARFATATLAALLLAGAGLALAQVLTLVSNLGGSNTTTTNDILAQSFRTGSNSQGYTLSEVQLELSAGTSTAVVAVQVKEDNSGAPGTVVASLSDPVAIDVEFPITPNLSTFTAPANTPLAANTTYWVVVNEQRPDDLNKLWGYRTNADSETGETGWTIGDGSLSKATASDTWTTRTSSLKITVKGTAVRAPNTPATGAPAITGTAQVGQTLTAGIGTIADTDGLTTKTFPDDYTFQWSREDADGTNPADITDATSTTYRLVAADQGKKVKVQVSFQDDAGNDEERTSTAWPSGTDTVASDTTAPTLVSRTVNGATVVLTFSEALDETSVPAASAFFLFPLTASNLAVVGRTVTFTVSPPVAHGDRRTVSYVKPSDNPLKDLSGNEVASFNALLLTNLTPNPVPPEFVVATVNGAALVMQYDIDFDEASVPAASAFAVKVEGAARNLATLTPVAVTGRRVTLTLDSAATAGQAVTVSYTPPGSNPLQSTAGTDAVALTDESVVNVSGDTAAPTLVRAVAETTFGVVLTYGELLDVASVPATSAFTVLIEGNTTPRTLASVVVSGRTVTLVFSTGQHLSRALGATVSYTPPSMNPIQDVVGNDAEALSNRSVTTMGTAFRMLTISSATVNGTSLVLTYEGNLEETAVPGADAFTVKVTPSGGGMPQERDLASTDPVTVSGTTVTLTLDSPVVTSDTVTVSYAVPTGLFADPIQSSLGVLAGALTDHAVTNYTNTAATGAPAISGITQVNGIMIASTSGIMDTNGLTSVRYAYQWLRVDGGSDTAITGATGSTYRLTASDAGKKVKVKVTFQDDDGHDEELTSAAYPTTGAIADDPTGPGMPGGLVSNTDRPFRPDGICVDHKNYVAQSFTTGSQTDVAGYSLRDITVRITDPPSNWDDISAFLHESSVWSTGRLMQLTNPTGGGGNKAFGLTSGTNVTLKPDTTYWVRLESSNTTLCDMLVSRTDSDHESKALEGWSIGNHLWVSLDSGVTGGADAGTSLLIQVNGAPILLPMLSTATVSGASLVLTYDKDLDTTAVPGADAFTVKVTPSGGGMPQERDLASMDPVAVSGKTVTLTLASPVASGDTVTVSYAVPDTDPIQDSQGSQAAALTDHAVTNNTPASSDATLRALSLGSSVPLSPTFSAGTTSYRAWVANSVDSVTVTASASDAGASVAIAGDGDTATPNTATLAMDVGRNTVAVKVTAADTTTATTTVAVVREAAAPTADPAALLSANVTAGESDDGRFVGFFKNSYGAMTDGDFEFGVDTYEVNVLGMTDDLGTAFFGANRIGICFVDSAPPSEALVRRLILTVGSRDLPLSLAFLAGGALPCYALARPAGLDKWEWGDVATVKLSVDNDAPVFADDTLTREVAENTAADTHIGAVIPEATDDDGDTLLYTMEGTDADSFVFDDSTRQLKTKAGVDYDYETKASYSVTVRATDPAGASDTVAVTINLLNLPAVSIARQQARVLMSDGEVRFTFSAPTRPPGDLSINVRAVQDRAWFSDANLRHRGAYYYDDNDWSNHAYVFDEVGHPSPVESGDFTVTIQPGEGYELGAVTSQTVEIVAGDPLITVRALEATKTVAEGAGTVTLTLRAETIANAPKPTSSTRIQWSTRPDTALGGGTDFENADSSGTPFRYFGADFTQHGNVWRQDKTVSVTINDDSTAERSDEQFHIEMTRHAGTHRLVKLANADGTFCEDNATGVNCGATVVITDNDNRAPVFPDSAGTRSVPENSPAGTAVGAPVAATDEDGHTLTYTLEGTDKESFDFDTATGRISTKTGVDYDHETKDAYAVTVTAQDPVGARAGVDVAISVGDVDEKPQTPAAPVVNATLGTPTEITIGWTKPGLDGGPDIIGYEVQYRQAGEIAWIDVTHDTTQTEATVGSLPINVEYEARVRALNGETPSDWSPPGRGASGTPEGTIELIVAPASAEEGGTVAWRVRATSEEDERPRADLDMRVQVTGVDVSAVAGEDFGAVDRTLTFVRGDFTRRAVNGQMRWVAEKSGTVRITDEAEVETDETFAIEMSLASGRGNWSIGAHRAEVSIPNTDTWAIELTAQPSAIAEAETRPVTLTATVVPTGQGCVAGFPFTLGLAVGGTASNPADYRIEGADALQVAACQASATWTVTLASMADLVADDAETVSFTPVVAGADAFEAPRLRGAQVTIDEAPGLALDTFALAIEEGGDASYTVVLIKRPSGTVTVTPSVSGDSDVTVSGPLTFTRESWNVAQRITVSAAHDSDDEHDMATVSLRASGADYGGVTGADVRVEVDDDEASQGVLSARLSNGAEASYLGEAPRSHDGRPFRIRLQWSHVRTDGWQHPERAIGAGRAIRVTGADVRAVKVQRTPIGKPNGTPKVWVWDQAALLLEFTPQAAGTDVTMVLEPLPCPGVHALCAWDANHRYTGLERRMSWTVEGVGTAPETAPEVTLSTRTEPQEALLLAQFTSVRTGSHYRVQLQGAGGDWTGAREWTGSRAGGGTQLVTIDGVDHALRYDVRVRWENRQGAGPWSEVRTHDPSLAASLPPQRIWLNQREPWGEALLGWTPNALSAGEASVAKQQYRLARFPDTIDGFASGGRGFSDNAWRDIPDSGTGQANEGGYVITGIGNVWEVKVQMRTVNSDGVVGPPSGEREIAHPGPTRANAPPREVSDAGPDGVYGIGETIAVELRMSRPVQVDGSGTPSIEIDLGGTPRTATLSRIHHSNDHFYYSLPYPPWGRGDTVRFEYVVAEDDGAPQGFAVPAGRIRTNGAQIVNAMRGGSGYGLPVSGVHSAMGPGRPVRTVRTAVTSIEWYGHQVWMHFDHDLDPRSRIDDARSQFAPAFSVSNQGGVQAARPVTDARIVRGRGSTPRCGRGEAGCRTVQLALGQVYRPDPLRTYPWWDEPAADETVWMSYTPHAGLPKLRLRDTAGHDVEAFSRVQARALSAGTDPVLSVNDARGREGGSRTLHFQVRLVPPATSEVRVDYATSDGTAVAGQDYTARSGTLVFAAGETQKTVGVAIIDDALEDSGEKLTLNLTNPSGARIGDGAGTGTILNSEDLVEASFSSVPESHDGSRAFTVRLTFGEELPARTVSAQTLRDSALVLTNATVTGVEQVDAASRRDWEITLEPASDGEVIVGLAPKESCAEAGAICAEDGRGLAEAVSATVPGPAPEPVRVVSASVSSDAGANGTWDAGEEVVAAIGFSDTVTVTGTGTPALGVLLDGVRRAAAYAGGSGTDTLTFRLAVAAEDAGAGRARLVANGLVLNENTILDSAGRAVDTAFAVAPWVTGVALAADVSGDGAWTPGESIEVRLTFSEAVTVTVADGPPSVGVTAVAAGADAARRVEYVSGSGSATLVFRDGLTDTDGTLGRIAVTANSLALAGGRVVSQATGLAAETGHDGTAPPTALSAPRIAGVAQVGATLEASFAEAPGGTVAYRWLRGSEEIEGATASIYAPVAADVGEALSVRVERGGASVTSAPSAPVWPSPVNPPLAAGEEEVLSATLTLGSWDGFPARIAGYSRVLGASFGAMDETAFEDGGTRHAVDFLVVNENGQLALATGATGPAAAGLAAYWNEHRIAQLEANTLEEGLRILVGRTPQSGAAYMRYMDGSSDGVRVAVSLRRASAAQPVTPHDGAPVGLTAGFAAAPPDEHDGTSPFTFRIAFSENLHEYSYSTLRDTSLTVMQGTARLTPTKVARVYRKDPARANTAWTVEVTPQSKEDIAIGLGPSPACDAAGAMCTADGRVLSNALAQTVLGPPGLSVADATVREAEGATMDFVVTLSRASVSTVTVRYATSGGSAVAGSDYTEQSGTLTFAPEERSKTVSVAVLNDDHDDGGETFTLTLSNPAGGERVPCRRDGDGDHREHRPDAAGVAWAVAGAGGDALGGRRLELRFGYGFGVFGDRFTSTPQAGLALSDGQREASLGWRLGTGGDGAVSMELGVEGTRRESADGDAENALMLRGLMRW